METKEILDALQTKAQEIFDNFKKDVITKTELESKMAEITAEIKAIKGFDDSVLTKAISDLKKQSDEIGIELSKVKQIGTKMEHPKTLTEGVKEFLSNPEIKSYIDNGARGTSIGVKTLVDMTMANAVTRPTTPYNQLLGGLPVYAPERKISMTDIIPVGMTESETVTFNQEYEFEDGVTTLTENQATGKTSFKLRPANLTAGRIGTHLIVSKRMLKNEKYLMSHIASRIPQQIKKAEDTQILNGAGAGADLIGLMQNASAFSAGTFAGTIAGAQ